MPRPRTSPYWIVRIVDLMLNEGLGSTPRMIASIIQDEDASLEYDNPLKGTSPLEPTIKKYLSAVTRGDLDVNDLHKFEWPQDIGPGDDQIPLEYERHALDGLGYYLDEHDIRPMRSLIKWFTRVAACSEGCPIGTQAVWAEQLWYADLINKVDGRERPSTEYIERQLASKSWKTSEVDEGENRAELLDSQRSLRRMRRTSQRKKPRFYDQRIEDADMGLMRPAMEASSPSAMNLDAYDSQVERYNSLGNPPALKASLSDHRDSLQGDYDASPLMDSTPEVRKTSKRMPESIVIPEADLLFLNYMPSVNRVVEEYQTE